MHFSREKVHVFHEIPKEVCDPRKVKCFKDCPKGKGRWLPQITRYTSGNVDFGPPTQILPFLDFCAGSPLPFAHCSFLIFTCDKTAYAGTRLLHKVIAWAKQAGRCRWCRHSPNRTPCYLFWWLWDSLLGHLALNSGLTCRFLWATGMQRPTYLGISYKYKDGLGLSQGKMVASENWATGGWSWSVCFSLLPFELFERFNCVSPIQKIMFQFVPRKLIGNLVFHLHFPGILSQ